jgi:hypothetical protein
MKRVFTLSLAAVMAVNLSFAASAVVPATAISREEIVAPAPDEVAPLPVVQSRVLKATDVNIPLGNTGKTINLQELATMRAADLEQMTGKKMGWMRRMEFRLAQRKLRHSINADGTLNNKRLATMAGGDMSGETGFHIGGFALGLLLGLIGVLIAYLINDDKHSNRVKWSWIGCGVLLVIILLSAA